MAPPRVFGNPYANTKQLQRMINERQKAVDRVRDVLEQQKENGSYGIMVYEPMLSAEKPYYVETPGESNDEDEDAFNEDGNIGDN